MPMRTFPSLPGAALLVLVPSLAFAQTDDEEWLERCREREWDRGRESFCEVRVERMAAPSGAVRVSPGRNGGIAIEGWDRADVEVHARIRTRARTVEEARDLASEVRISLGDVIEADGPQNEDDANWYVNFVVYVPERSDLQLTTRNGPLSVRGVTGRMELDAQNGPVSLRGVGGDVRARTRNGPLHVELEGSRWEGAGLDAESRNGPVTLEIPENYSARLETGTVNGPMHTTFPITVTLNGRLSGHIETVLGDGGAPIRVVTTNGPVRLRRAGG